MESSNNKVYQIGETLSPEQAMQCALDISLNGAGLVSPNPLVGCVIVDKEHHFLSMGAHLKFGGPHAEINAIQDIQNKQQLVGATFYVTLEPCAHQGKTGSCAKRITELSVKKVVYGAKDPNPLVAGQGIEILKAAGVEVECLTGMKEACLQSAEQFHHHIKTKKPFVAIKVGVSLDGKMALPSKESQWITGPEARLYARNLRAHYDATMVGAGTIIHDNPTLDFRDTKFALEKKNKIIIVDPKSLINKKLLETKVFKTHGPENIFVLRPLSANDDLEELGVGSLNLDLNANSWQKALEALYKLKIYSIYVEGGSFVFAQLLKHRLAQKLYLFQANKIIGDGMSWSKAFSIDRLDEALKLKEISSTSVGDDTLRVFYFSFQS